MDKTNGNKNGNRTNGTPSYKKAYFTGLIVILIIGTSIKLLGFFEKLGSWAVPDVVLTYIPYGAAQTAVLTLVGIIVPFVIGILLQKLFLIPNVRRWFLSETPHSSLVRRIASNLFLGGIDYFDYLDKPEVAWNISRGVYKIGLFARQEGNYILVMEPTVGFSPGNGSFWLLEEGSFAYTGRTGVDLWPDLIKMGLGTSGNKPIEPKKSSGSAV